MNAVNASKVMIPLESKSNILNASLGESKNV